jgi:hypothetical protein
LRREYWAANVTLLIGWMSNALTHDTQWGPGVLVAAYLFWLGAVRSMQETAVRGYAA